MGSKLGKTFCAGLGRGSAGRRAADPVIVVLAALFPLAVAVDTTRRQGLVEIAAQIGVRLEPHPGRSEIVLPGRLVYQTEGLSSAEVDVGIALGLARCLLLRGKVEVTEDRTIELAWRIWARLPVEAGPVLARTEPRVPRAGPAGKSRRVARG